MPRPPRPRFAGAVYHVVVNAAWHESFFRRESDRDIFFWLLDGVVDSYGWDCIAYCFMTTHVHLAIETPLPNISAGMQRLLANYAQGFNRRYRRRGHVVANTFDTVLVVSDEQLLAVARYIALNPVAAGACRAAEDWLWSSFRASAGFDAPPRLLKDGALLKLFDGERVRAELEWRRVVAEAIARGEHLKPRPDRPDRTGVETPSHFRSGL